MPPKFVSAMSAALSAIGLIAFVALYSIVMWKAWRRLPAPGSDLVYVATALAGLVGGIVAAAFGQKLPSPPNATASFVRVGATRVGHMLTASPASTLAIQVAPTISIREAIGIAYVVLYFAVGLAAGATWIFAPQAAPDVVRNLAMIVLGLVIAIAGSYLR